RVRYVVLPCAVDPCAVDLVCCRWRLVGARGTLGHVANVERLEHLITGERLRRPSTVRERQARTGRQEGRRGRSRGSRRSWTRGVVVRWSDGTTLSAFCRRWARRFSSQVASLSSVAPRWDRRGQRMACCPRRPRRPRRAHALVEAPKP